MTASPSGPATPAARPRSVTAAFWLWLLSAVLLVFYGLVVVTIKMAGPAVFLRSSGVILIVAGAALGYLSSRSRADWRFARAAVALSLGLVVFLCIMLAIQMLGLLMAPVVLFLIVATGLVVRSSSATAWFAAQNTGDSQGV
ncbi:hypothetical protein BH09ACT7_BH09ACT7_20290 [soil metagenome]